MAIFLVFLVGLIMGLVLKTVTKLLIKNRNGNVDSKLLSGVFSYILWGSISGIGYIVIGLIFKDKIIQLLETAFVFSICLSISAVDFKVRRIPNILLLLLLLFKIIIIIVGKNQTIYNALFGLLFAAMVFIIPAKFGKMIGAGDIKLACVIGFYLGPYGFLQAMIIMALSLLVYWVYLLLTKKGSLSTSTALGPYISLGFIVTLCYNFVSF